MCTVSYIPPTNDRGFILTSNRDEKKVRPTLSPQVYEHNGILLTYPKDDKAGGSWIAANNTGRVCCLLNGGLYPHKKQDFYIYSRGKILLEATSSDKTIFDFFYNINLSNVEPFTIVTIDYENSSIKQFSELIWDGTNRHFKYLDSLDQHIWSSVTLYDTENRNLRQKWFYKFMKDKKYHPSANDIIGFHSGKHTTDKQNNLIMQREGGLKTVSITQITQVNQNLEMRYIDLLNDTKHHIEICSKKTKTPVLQ